MYSSAFVCLFVCLLTGLRKNYSTDFQIFGEKAAQGPRKKRIDFDANQITSWLELRLRLGGRQVLLRVTVTFCGIRVTQL